MSTFSKSTCFYCNKECKSSDSRPFPNSKSKDRIHNKCHIKRNLVDKKQSGPEATSTAIPSRPTSSISSASSIMERMTKEISDINEATNAKKFAKLMDEKSRQTADNGSDKSVFFDLKAGIAKPHEKRRFLHHRNLSEMVARYDDNGFKDEAAGRAYDHTGKDLNTLGDSDEDTSEIEQAKNESIPGKRRAHQNEDRNKLAKVKLDEQNPCWFCLSSPKVEKHLIIAIGDFCYLTLAKGGLNDNHLLLIPINHIQCLNDSKSNSEDLLAEVENFKKSLVDYFSEKNLGVIFFERNFRSVHWQLQVVPIPLEVFDGVEEKIKLASKSYFKNTDYHDIPSGCSLGDIIQTGVPYFFWQLEPLGSRFVTRIQVEGSFFPVQFGRLVLANNSILDCPSKVDWRKCVKSEEEYKEMVRQFKYNYKEPF